jgi:16S rRNA (adenine1518-N6/adenine1519-N6)-dimethyltransferase
MTYPGPLDDAPDADRDPRRLLDRAGTDGDRRRDQHFLVDDRVLDRVPTNLPDEAETSHVLEIGPGTGALTDRLLAIGDRVTVVERDPELVAFLREEFADAIAADRLTVVEGDATDVPLPDVSASVSNLPYGAASEILFRLLPLEIPLVVMVQREFAQRLAADPGTDEYGRLSVTAGHYADVEVVEPVPPQAFSPPPAVDSAVVRVRPRDPDYDVPDDGLFADLVTGIFTQRRKTMRNGVRNTAHISGLDDPDAVVDAADEDLLSRRPEQVTPAEFAALTRLAAEVGVDA